MQAKSSLTHFAQEKCIFYTSLGKLYHFAPEKSPEQAKMTSIYTITQLFSRRKATFPSSFFSKSDVPSHWNLTLQLSHLAQEYARPVDSLDYYKVFVTQANGTGAFGETLSTPIIGEPNMGHTDTFLSIGKFSTKTEAENCLKYIKTKFARTMLGTLKVTQNAPSSVYANVPLQDFTTNSDIDWTQSVADIDQQLYKKYGLTEEEQQFIETMIKPM